jgi:hypothetical protein
MALEKVVSLFAPNDPLRLPLHEEDGFPSLFQSGYSVLVPRKLDRAHSEKVSTSQTMDAIRRLSGHNA